MDVLSVLREYRRGDTDTTFAINGFLWNLFLQACLLAHYKIVGASDVQLGAIMICWNMYGMIFHCVWFDNKMAILKDENYQLTLQIEAAQAEYANLSQQLYIQEHSHLLEDNPSAG
jgi:succinate-acetate transporter protein